MALDNTGHLEEFQEDQCRENLGNAGVTEACTDRSSYIEFGYN